MIGAVIAQDNSTGGKKKKKVELKAAEGRWREKKSNDGSPYVSLRDRNDSQV